MQVSYGEQQPGPAEVSPSVNEAGKKIGPRWPPIEVPEEVKAKCGRMVVAQPSNDTRGHTGYLTFAWKSVGSVPTADLS